MDDEEKRAYEEEDEQARKRRQKQAEEQEAEEEAWKSQRRSSRVEVDEGNEDDNDENSKKKKDNKDDENNNGEDNKDESNDENNNSPENKDNKESDSSQNSSNSDNKKDSSSQSSQNQEQQNNIQNADKNKKVDSNKASKNDAKPKEGANPKKTTPKPESEIAKGKAGKTASKEGAKTAAKTGGKAAGNSASGIGKIIAKCGTGLIVILIIIIVLGIIFFFLTMPGMVVGKIGQALDSFLTGVANFFDGSNANRRSVNREQVINAARYLDNMGYDLQGYGFLDEEKKDIVSAKEDTGFLDSLTSVFFDDGENSIDPTEINIKDFEETDYKERIEKEKGAGRAGDDIKQIVLSKTWEEVKNQDDDEIKKSMILMRGSDGDIEFAKSKYLYMYLVAANTTYLVRNDNVGIGGRILKFIGSNPDARTDGVGLLYFTYPQPDDSGYTPKPKDYISGLSDDVEFEKPESGISIFGRTVLAFSNRYKIDKENKKLIIYNSNDGWFKSTFYTYNLGGWISQYGMPLQLSLALHLSTMAPDFAYKVAERAAFDTRVEMGLIEIKGVDVKLQLMLDLDGTGNTKRYTVERDWAAHRLKTGDGDNDNEEGYTSQTEANQQSEQENTDNSNTVPKTCMEELEEIEKEIKNAANGDKLIAGPLTWEFGADSNSIEDENADMYVGENTKIKNFCNGISSNYIIAMQNILKSHGFANVDSGYFKVNSDKITSDEVEKVKKIIKDYFKVTPIEEVVYCTTDTGSFNLNQNGISIKNAIGNSNIIRDGDTHSYQYNSSSMGEIGIALNTGSDPSGSKAKETRNGIWQWILY